jgi:hypothetical protein
VLEINIKKNHILNIYPLTPKGGKDWNYIKIETLILEYFGFIPPFGG